MHRARQNVEAALGKASQPVVLWSGGKDSMLLLTLVREIDKSVPCIWFRTGFDETFAKQTIHDLDLTVYSYSPTDVYVIPNGDDLSMVHEFSFGRDRLPAVVDIADGEECSLTRFTKRSFDFYQPWDVILVGYKDGDGHATVARTSLFPAGFKLGGADVVAPIRHMTNDQVRAALFELNVSHDTNDELPLCTRCMQGNVGKVWCPKMGKMIPRHEWEREQSLLAFRRRFGLEVNHG